MNSWLEWIEIEMYSPYNDLKSSTYIDLNVENNDKDPKFEFGDFVGIFSYSLFFVNDYTPNWSEQVLWLKNLKILSWTHVIGDLHEEETFGRSMKNIWKRQFLKKIWFKLGNRYPYIKNIDKADIGILGTTPIDISNSVKNDSVKKTLRDQLVEKVNTFQINYTNDLV